jgi:hypothetical protein
VAIKPRPAFRDLSAQALTGTPDVLLVSPEEAAARLLAETGANLGAGGDGGDPISPLTTFHQAFSRNAFAVVFSS